MSMKSLLKRQFTEMEMSKLVHRTDKDFLVRKAATRSPLDARKPAEMNSVD